MSEFDEATLWTLAASARARTFYDRNGWHSDGAAKRATIGGAEVDEVRSRCRLADRPRDG